MPSSRTRRRACLQLSAVLGACAALAAAVAVTVALPVAVAAPSRAADPAVLDFSLASDQPGGGGITLGAPTGSPRCTTDAAGEQTCVTAIGTSTSYALGAGVHDNGANEDGRLSGSCSVMYAGTQTTYTSRTGRQDATGSEDCSVVLTFATATATGALHEQRVLVDNVETNTFTLTMTGGTGRYAGLNAVMVHTESNPWQVPPPMGTRSTSSRRLTLHWAGPRQGGGGQDRIKLTPSARPLADITSLGLLVPANAPASAQVTASVGSTCSGAITGPRTLALPAAKVTSGTRPTRLASFPAGTFSAKATWKLKVACTDARGRTATVTRSLAGFLVTKKAKS